MFISAESATSLLHPRSTRKSGIDSKHCPGDFNTWDVLPEQVIMFYRFCLLRVSLILRMCCRSELLYFIGAFCSLLLNAHSNISPRIALCSTPSPFLERFDVVPIPAVFRGKTTVKSSKFIHLSAEQATMKAM